jgi:hypothetical protein
MGRTACTEPQCLYKGAVYLTFLFNVELGTGKFVECKTENYRFFGIAGSLEVTVGKVTSYRMDGPGFESR